MALICCTEAARLWHLVETAEANYEAAAKAYIAAKAAHTAHLDEHAAQRERRAG